MATFILIMRVLAVVLLGLAAYGLGGNPAPRWSLGWAGLAVWFLAALLSGVGG
jgi:hypothetical protein